MKNKKHLLNLTASTVLSILFASFLPSKPDGAFVNTIYTVTGIMFSIGMGMICTLSPDKIQNHSIYLQVKQNVLNVRNVYLGYFAIVSFAYLFYQAFPSFSVNLFTIKGFVVVLDATYFTASLNTLGLVYFIVNFIEIQRLNFDISDRTRQ